MLAARDDQGFAVLEDLGFAKAGFLAQELELVVVADDDRGALDAVGQLAAVHARALLPGVEDVTDAERPALLRILHHRLGIVRRDDRQVAGIERPERQLAGVGHRARIEGRNLVVRLIGRAEEGGGELPRHLLDL